MAATTSSSTTKVNQDNNNFGPTLGFAYTPHWSDHGIGNGTTVIRGGYQVTYDVFYNNLLSNMAAASPNALANTPVPSNSTATTPRGLSNLSAVLPALVPVPLTPYSTVALQLQQEHPQSLLSPLFIGCAAPAPGKHRPGCRLRRLAGSAAPLHQPAQSGSS